MRTLLAALGVGIVIAVAAPAYADPNETTGDDAGFLSALQKVGIHYPARLKPSPPANRCAGA